MGGTTGTLNKEDNSLAEMLHNDYEEIVGDSDSD